MEASCKGAILKGSSGGKGQYGIIKNLEAIYQRIVGFSLNNALPQEMLASCLPYEASKTYRIMKTEFECRRSRALVDVHRHIRPGF